MCVCVRERGTVCIYTLCSVFGIQWNLSNQDTNGAEESVAVSEVSSFSEVEMHARVVCTWSGKSV